jgi:hypothetical protein
VPNSTCDQYSAGYIQFANSAHQIPLESLIDQILLSGKITTAEVNQLSNLLASQVPLSEEQRVMIQRVLYGWRQSMFQVIG